MHKFKLIRLTELVKTSAEGDVGERPLLLNPTAVVIVSEADFMKDDVILIGQSKSEKVSLIGLANGARIFVKESMDKIGSLINSQSMSSNGKVSMPEYGD